ncbi:MAG: hypothetical protein LBF67_03975, partial [Prevotellaceae bacterium]|jgi:hypothetical protein|nr:hypothetical protein [Prevotellaceae bacterium]
MVNASASYSYYNGNSNVGVGLLIGRKVMQWHIIADNLLAVNYKTAQNVNLRMGFSFLFGKGRAQRSGPLAGGDAPTDDPAGASADSTAGAPGTALTDLLNNMPNANAQDTAANLLHSHPAQDTVKKDNLGGLKTQANAKPSREALLRRAMLEEAEAGEAVGANKKGEKASDDPKTKKEDLLKKALQEEAEDKNIKAKKTK